MRMHKIPHTDLTASAIAYGCAMLAPWNRNVRRPPFRPRAGRDGLRALRRSRSPRAAALGPGARRREIAGARPRQDQARGDREGRPGRSSRPASSATTPSARLPSPSAPTPRGSARKRDTSTPSSGFARPSPGRTSSLRRPVSSSPSSPGPRPPAPRPSPRGFRPSLPAGSSSGYPSPSRGWRPRFSARPWTCPPWAC